MSKKATARRRSPKPAAKRPGDQLSRMLVEVVDQINRRLEV